MLSPHLQSLLLVQVLYLRYDTKVKVPWKRGILYFSAAIFVFMVLDDMVMTKDGLKLGGLIRRAHELPTPLGKIDILDGGIQQRMHKR